MLLRLILLFTLLPLIDFAILLKIGNHIGFRYTLAIVIITGFVGAYLAKSEGRHIIQRIRFDISRGRLPADELIEGLCVIVGGSFLLAPGLITDALGIFLVLPFTRILFINAIKNRFKRMLTEGNVWFYFKK
ncbi:MAG TPA: FxsA family protein [Oscillospiraceae bacterium]|nr:FxsA family protein [Oscillospiraceae bacterium]